MRVYKTNIELIENYALAKADNFKGWVIHHKLETHDSANNLREVSLSMNELIALGMYYERPEEELIFMKRSEHVTLHNTTRKHEKWNEEQRKRLSELQKGRKRKPCSEETKSKISAAMKGKGHLHTEEEKIKIGNAHRGKVVSEETREKIRLARLGKKQSDETKRLRAEKLKAYWQNRRKEK